MAAIEYVIFDLDDTLCDYQKAKKNAISLVNRVLESSGIDVNQFWNSYSLIEPALFRQFVNGNISRDEYRLRRYADVMQGARENPLAFSSELNDIYMKEANRGITVPVQTTTGVKLSRFGKIFYITTSSGNLYAAGFWLNSTISQEVCDTD